MTDAEIADLLRECAHVVARHLLYVTDTEMRYLEELGARCLDAAQALAAHHHEP